MQQIALTVEANHTTDTHMVRSKQKLNKLIRHKTAAWSTVLKKMIRSSSASQKKKKNPEF
jgi:hypothetical protein